ncbi:MAG: hypothetical protein ACT4OE_11725 [Sphingosinicella sp.]
MEAGNDNNMRRGGRAAEALQAEPPTRLEKARARAAGLTREAADQISVYPASAVIGGLIIGALAGWLLPALKQEKTLLSPAGKKLNAAARRAAQRGAAIGRERVEDLRKRTARQVGEAVIDAISGGRK